MPPLSPGRCLLAQKKHQNIIMSLKKLYDSEQLNRLFPTSSSIYVDDISNTSMVVASEMEYSV